MDLITTTKTNALSESRPRCIMRYALSLAFNAPYIEKIVLRIDRSIKDNDPYGAIGGAKELIETACKTILDNQSIPYEKEWDVLQLMKETIKALKLVPNDVPPTFSHV